MSENTQATVFKESAIPAAEIKTSFKFFGFFYFFFGLDRGSGGEEVVLERGGMEMSCSELLLLVFSLKVYVQTIN